MSELKHGEINVFTSKIKSTSNLLVDEKHKMELQSNVISLKLEPIFQELVVSFEKMNHDDQCVVDGHEMRIKSRIQGDYPKDPVKPPVRLKVMNINGRL